MTDAVRYDAIADFGENYDQSREKFLSAMSGKGEVHSIPHPEKGSEGQDLYLDIGVIGPEDAKGALVLIAGTHGPELYAGSGSQTAFLNSGLIDNYSDLRVVLIHAHNPFGCAWFRRTDHENIDLNRNYYDFSVPFTPHPGYDRLRPVIVPDKWDPAAVKQGMAEYQEKYGRVEMLAAMVTGQSHDPDGLFYRGNGPSWSRRVIEEWLPKLTQPQETVSVIDFHTGLGPYGEPYMVHGYKPGSKEFVDFKKAYEGEVRSTEDPDDIDEDLPASPEGPIVLAMHKIISHAQTYAVVIEYGTVPPEEVFPALMQDNWWHAHGDKSEGLSSAVKQNMRRVFYPLEDKWKDMVWKRAVWAIERSARLARGQV